MPPRPLRQAKLPLGPALPPTPRIDQAFERLDGERLLNFLVSSALSIAEMKRILAGRVSRSLGTELPVEMFGQLVIGVAFADPDIADELAQALHERLAWDRAPSAPEEWERIARDRPLEALWMAALSDSKSVRKGFSRFARECQRLYRASPACRPPSWELIDATAALGADLAARVERLEKEIDDGTRRLTSERQRLEDLREELRRLRRENSELRAARADADRRASLARERDQLAASAEERARVESLERRLRKTEKEREHLERQLERLEQQRSEPAVVAAPSQDEAAVVRTHAGSDGAREAVADPRPGPAIGSAPRSRILAQMLRKLMKKRKIGAAHTHEDNVYRGIPDHEKGLAKEAMDLLYREGILVPKSTIADPHVSLRPERVRDVEAILAGRATSPRLEDWLEGRD